MMGPSMIGTALRRYSPPKASWCWYIIPAGTRSTRLLTRLRTRYDWTSKWIIYYLIYDIGDIIMMSKCMKGIKQRAENQSS